MRNVQVDGGMQKSKGDTRRIMENQGVRTCAGCVYNRKRVARGCRITTEGKCALGNDKGHAMGYCSEITPRFEKQEVKRDMEVELL